MVRGGEVIEEEFSLFFDGGGVWEDDDEWPLLDWATNRAEEIMKVEAPARNDMADDDMADDEYE